MKKLFKSIFLILFALPIFIPNAKSLDLSVTHATFYNDQEKYIEVYLYAVGSTVNYDTLENGLLMASLEFTITFTREGEIINFDKFILHSPPDSTGRDFVGIKRFALPNGTYDLKVNTVDKQDAENSFNFEEQIIINFDPKLTQLSDIQLLSSYTLSKTQNEFVKNGYFLESVAFDYFPASIANLAFYLEVYNQTKDTYKASYLSYAIYRKQADGKSDMIIQKFKKLSDKSVQAMILQLPLSDIGSGNYELLVELRNRDKLLVDVKSQVFQRSNPVQDLTMKLTSDPGFEESFARKLKAQDVRYSLKALAPVCKGFQSSTLEGLFFNDDLKPKQYFLYNYFVEMYPADPEMAYDEFMKVADAVDKTYRSNVGYGFETDRGMIFMKYGKPADVVHVEDEPSAPPYEIWFYNKLDESKQYNIKFIFYNPSLATNDYILLHSNCRGERYNPRWEVELYRHAPNQQAGQNAASTQMEDNYRRNARKIWEEL